ncbi:MAG: hypothetical protein FWF81_04230 [Defluviitaleaceae bacterium]|nr:hypothetical protein [Defluviitaleaceae bacterium]
MGVTENKVFTDLLPWISGEAMIRLEYISIPLFAALSVAILNELFYGFLQKYYRYAQ